MEENGFTVLENKTIGHNMALYRKIRGIKAFEVAEGLGLKEAAYTRYERGEASITVDIVQKVAEIIKIDPMMLLSVSPGSFLENGSNSPNSANGCVSNIGSYNYQTYNEKQMEMMLKLMENMMNISQKLIDLMNKEGK
ncbi:MAG TPA: helix-turn-helix domain-containing protein [Bacteroidales bacterium]|nr:helix-turn-helix domain-containing protein [Bacteroidales bacterium]